MSDVTGYKYKEGSSECELFVNFPATATQKSLTHTLGARPDEVVIVQKTANHVYESAARTAALVYIRGTTGTSTCDVTVKKHMLSGAITETSSST